MLTAFSSKNAKALTLCLILVASILLLRNLTYGEAPPFRIGVTLGLTGKYAELAKQQKNGFTLWEREVNQRGGLLGRKVQLIIKDDQSNPALAKEIYESYLKNGEVDFIFCPYSSEITEAVAPIAERYGFPLIVSGASADTLWEKGYQYIFGLITPASKYMASFLDLLFLHDQRDLAILFADDAFSKNVAKGARDWAERLGLRVRFFESFKKGTKDLRELAKRAKDSQARVVILCGHFEEAINFRLSLEAIGWNPIYYATVGAILDEYYERLGKLAELTFSSTVWHPGQDKKFYETFLKTYKIKPSHQAAMAYAAGELLEKAINRTRTFDRKTLRDTLATMEALTVLGRYKVDRTGKQIKNVVFVIQWQKGKKELVWPQPLQTAKPIFK